MLANNHSAPEQQQQTNSNGGVPIAAMTAARQKKPPHNIPNILENHEGGGHLTDKRHKGADTGPRK